MRPVAIIGAALIAAILALMLWKRSQWIGEMDAQCRSAMPLTSGMATREEVLRQLGKPSGGELGRDEWPELEREFGDSSTEKMRDIAQRLEKHGRVMVYTRSNSIMFVYLNANGRATHASCFLQ